MTVNDAGVALSHLQHPGRDPRTFVGSRLGGIGVDWPGDQWLPDQGLGLRVDDGHVLATALSMSSYISRARQRTA